VTDPPVFWERQLAEVLRLRREVAALRDALRINSVGVEPLLDLIASLSKALRKAHRCKRATCSICDLITEADQLVPNDNEP